MIFISEKGGLWKLTKLSIFIFSTRDRTYNSDHTKQKYSLPLHHFCKPQQIPTAQTQASYLGGGGVVRGVETRSTNDLDLSKG